MSRRITFPNDWEQAETNQEQRKTALLVIVYR